VEASDPSHLVMYPVAFGAIELGRREAPLIAVFVREELCTAGQSLAGDDQTSRRVRGIVACRQDRREERAVGQGLRDPSLEIERPLVLPEPRQLVAPRRGELAAAHARAAQLIEAGRDVSRAGVQPTEDQIREGD